MGIYLGDIELDKNPLVSQALHDQFDRAMETVTAVRSVTFRNMTSPEIVICCLLSCHSLLCQRYAGEPTEADYARVAELAAAGFTSGPLLNDPDDPGDEDLADTPAGGS